jgi:hypothetical protein
MDTNDQGDRTKVEGVSPRRIPKCGSCGHKVWKRDRDIFERIGLCQRCALRQVEPLANSLYDALNGDPEGLVMAMGHTRASHYEALLNLALKLYEDGWRLTRIVEPPESRGEAE